MTEILTHEEAIAYGNDYYKDLITACCKIDEKHKEFVRMSLEALEQEPIEVEATKLQMAYNQGFEDCRKAVIDELKKWDWQELYLPIHFKENIIDVIPSVNPQEPKYCDRNICIKNEYNGISCDECEVTKSQEPKTGYWIENAPEYQNIDPPYICSECGHSNLIKTNYCEQCGARMESEVQE